MIETSCSPEKRDFLKWLAGLGLVASALTLGSLGLRYLKPNLKSGPPTKFRLLSPENYLLNSISFSEKGNLFVIRTHSGFKAASAVCTHLGCIVDYDPKKHVFHCPCHGAVFSENGRVLKGPPPKPLPWFQISMDPTGRLVVNKEKTVSADTVFEI